MVTNKIKIIFLLLLLSGVIFRSIYPSYYGFGFDQIQILTNADNIAAGNFTLIGPRTGPADMFTGPLIYYLTALILFAVPSPWTIVAVSVFISLITALVIFFVSKRYISLKFAFLALGLWSFSPLLIYFDRVTWNPNLTLLASFLVFLPLTAVIKNKTSDYTDLFLILLGCFLGYQAHFAGLLLPAFVVFILIIWRQLNLKIILSSVMGLTASLFPTLLFDIRHGWQNLNGLINFLSDKDAVNFSTMIFRFFGSVTTTIKTMGQLVSFHLNRETILFFGLMIVLYSVVKILLNYQKHNDQLIKISLVWIVLTAISISLYTQSAPEYYYFIALPAIMVLAIQPLLNIRKNTFSPFLMIVILATYIGFNFEKTTNRGHLQLGNQSNIVEDLKTYNKINKLSAIAYDFRPDIDRIGIQYLIENQLTFEEEGYIVHIVPTENYTKKYGNYGLWIDPRINQNSNYLTLENIIVETPSSMTLLEDHSKRPDFHNFQVFQVMTNETLNRDLLIVAKKITDPFDDNKYIYMDLIDSIDHSNTNSSWPSVNYLRYQGFIQKQENFLIIYIPKELEGFNFNILTKIKSFDSTPKLLYR